MPLLDMEKIRPLSERSVFLASDARRIEVAPGESQAVVMQVDVQAGETVHVGVEAVVREGASLDVVVMARGKGEVRVARRVTVAEGGTLSCIFAGEFFGEARCSVDDDVAVVGKGASCRLIARSVLRDAASIATCGRIVLGPDSVQSSAHAAFEHLLLGDRVRAQSIPELVVGVDDVTCGHVASIARPRAEELFYLASRGLSRFESEQMLAAAFLCPVREAYVSSQV